MILVTKTNGLTIAYPQSSIAKISERGQGGKLTLITGESLFILETPKEICLEGEQPSTTATWGEEDYNGRS